MYLVEYPEALILLDSGCRCDVDKVKRFIEEVLNKQMSDLKLVLVSHAHPDHSGGASFYQKRFGTKIAGPKNLNDWYRGFSGFITYLIDLCLAHLVAWKKGTDFERILFPRKIELDYELENSQKVPGFEDWCVLAADGHTISDLSFYHERDSIAYIADNIVGSNGKFFRPYPIFSPSRYKESLQKYIDLKIKTLMLAHHGAQQIEETIIQRIMDGIPTKARIHRNTLIVMLRQFFK